MPTITTDTLTRLYNKGEVTVSRDVPFLVERLTFPLVAGQGEYIIPDYVTQIRRITYLGTKVWPLGERMYRYSFQNGGQSGTPFWYVYNNVLSNKIRFYPGVPTSLSSATGNLWAEGIPTGLIIEYFRLANNTTFVLPDWIRNRLLKRYVAYQSFLIEGPNQSNKFTAYFQTEYQKWELTFKTLISEYYSYGRLFTITGRLAGSYFPASPILPIDRFGISVDPGE